MKNENDEIRIEIIAELAYSVIIGTKVELAEITKLKYKNFIYFPLKTYIGSSCSKLENKLKILIELEEAVESAQCYLLSNFFDIKNKYMLLQFENNKLSFPKFNLSPGDDPIQIVCNDMNQIMYKKRSLPIALIGLNKNILLIQTTIRK